MKVRELIKYLEVVDQDKEVKGYWDSGVRSGVEGIVDDKDTLILIVDEMWYLYEKDKFKPASVLYTNGDK